MIKIKPNKRIIPGCLILFFFTFLNPAVVLAAPKSALIQGGVTDHATGAGIPGAKVSAYNARGKLVSFTSTDSQGNYKLTLKATGKITTKAKAQGYNPKSQVIQVKRGKAYTLNFALVSKLPPPNRPPVLNAIGNKAVAENQELEFTISATDPDGNTLTYSSVNLPQLATLDSLSGVFTWIPTYLQAGMYSVTFEVSDGRGGSDIETITITVNDAIVPEGIKNFDIEGINLNSWLNREYQSQDSDLSLINLAKTGANYVGILATWYIETTQEDGEYSKSNTIFSHLQKTPSDDDLIHVINASKNLGRKVFLKLHIRVILSEEPWGDTWAGNINPSGHEEWFNSYAQFVRHYAQLCQNYGVDILCFGTELTSMTKPEYAAQWSRVIDNIRTEYSGKLTFSSNMYLEYEQIPFWDRCDYLGIGPYFSLTENIANPHLDAIVDGWNDSPIDGKLIERLETWQSKYNKPVIFTEIGYCSVDTAAYKPWKGTQDEQENLPLQKRCYDALMLSLQDKPWFMGLFWWDWLCDPNAGKEGLNRKEYTPQNKDAESSLSNFYLGINSDEIASIKIVDGNDNEVLDETVLYVGTHKNLYVRAYNLNNQIIGYLPCLWNSSGSTGRLTNNEVGFAILSCISEGPFTVGVTDTYGHSDSANLAITQRYLRVPESYPTINSAMEHAQEGDTVLVSPGLYYESVVLKSGVNLTSEDGPQDTIIDAIGKTCAIYISSTLDTVARVSGFTIRNASGPGIVDNSANTTVIINNIIENNNGQGIKIYASKVSIWNNIIRNNNSVDYGGGIKCTSVGPGSEIVNNVIVNNIGLDGAGIYLSDEADVFVSNNIIVNNTASFYAGGIRVWASDATLIYNDVWNNLPGNYFNSQPGIGSISQDPRFINLITADYHLQPSSPCIDTGNSDPQYNDPDGSRNDMGIYGGPKPF